MPPNATASITANTSANGLPGAFSGFSASKVTLPTTANYTFNGSAAQVTGTTTGNVTMPTTVNNLTNQNPPKDIGPPSSFEQPGNRTVYDWIGRANGDEFLGFFTSEGHNGNFRLSRPKRESAGS